MKRSELLAYFRKTWPLAYSVTVEGYISPGKLDDFDAMCIECDGEPSILYAEVIDHDGLWAVFEKIIFEAGIPDDGHSNVQLDFDLTNGKSSCIPGWTDVVWGDPIDVYLTDDPPPPEAP